MSGLKDRQRAGFALRYDILVSERATGDDRMLRTVFIAFGGARQLCIRLYEELEERKIVFVELPELILQEAKQLAGYVSSQNRKLSECMLVTDNPILLSEAQKLGMPCAGYVKEDCVESLPVSCRYVIAGEESLRYRVILEVYQRYLGLPLTIVETQRLILRELTEEDIERMREISRKESVREYIYDIPLNQNEAYEFIRAYIRRVYPFYGYGYWGIFLKDNGALIGRCGLKEGSVTEQGSAELGYLLAPEYTGAGYVREAVNAVIQYAFQELQLKSLTARIREDNYRSLAVAEACGMVSEGVIQTSDEVYHLYTVYRSR